MAFIKGAKRRSFHTTFLYRFERTNSTPRFFFFLHTSQFERTLRTQNMKRSVQKNAIWNAPLLTTQQISWHVTLGKAQVLQIRRRHAPFQDPPSFVLISAPVSTLQLAGGKKKNPKDYHVAQAGTSLEKSTPEDGQIMKWYRHQVVRMSAWLGTLLSGLEFSCENHLSLTALAHWNSIQHCKRHLRRNRKGGMSVRKG